MDGRNRKIAEVIYALPTKTGHREITEYDRYKIDMPYAGKMLSEDETIVFLRRKQLMKRAASFILENIRKSMKDDEQIF